ncbi:2-hydroxyacyl-CoA dehydratase [Chloroflexota bacterium]
MNFYEEQVVKLERRIKKIEENPDETRMASNKLRYQMQLDHAKEKLQAWQEGKIFYSGGTGAYLGNLIQAMGFISGGADEAMFASTRAQAEDYLNQARAKGFPVDQSCDMVMMPMAVFESGNVPIQDMAICDNHACTAMCMRYILISHMYPEHNIPFYNIDVGFEEDEANLEHVVEQLQGFIEFCEKKFPGKIKYDEEKLKKIHAAQERDKKYSLEMYEMLKNRPTPIAGKDSHMIGFSSMYPEMSMARLKELRERVKNGVAAVPNEKLRVIWTVTNPVFMDVYKVLAKWGIAVLFQYTGPSRRTIPMPEPVYYGGRELTPLEKEAANYISELWQGRASKWIEGLIWAARDLKVDAVINYEMLGCAATLGLSKLTEIEVERELGIPVFQLEGSQWNSEYASEAQITEKLDEIAQTLLSQKGLL